MAHKGHYEYQLFGLSRNRVIRLLRVALAFALLSSFLFIGSSILQMNSGFSRMVQVLYVMAHLSAAFGVCLLFWSIVSVPDEVDGSRDKLPRLAVFGMLAYHLTAAVSYALAYQTDLYDVLLVVWWVRTLLSLFIVVDFIFFGDVLMASAGVLILIAFGAGGPYALPDSLGLIQWILAKMASISLYIVLYLCALRIYDFKDKRKSNNIV